MLATGSSTLEHRDRLYGNPECIIVDRTELFDSMGRLREGQTTVALLYVIVKLVVSYVATLAQIGKRLTNGAKDPIVGPSEVMNNCLMSLVSRRNLFECTQLKA